MSPRDVNLQLADSATPIEAAAAQTAVDTEGGFYAIVRLEGGALPDGDETFDLQVEASIDGGGNYYAIAIFRQLINTDDNIIMSRPCYVPRFPPATQTVTKVRLNCTAIAGATPSNPMNAWLEPMLSLGVPAIDEVLKNGLAELS